MEFFLFCHGRTIYSSKMCECENIWRALQEVCTKRMWMNERIEVSIVSDVWKELKRRAMQGIQTFRAYDPEY